MVLPEVKDLQDVNIMRVFRQLLRDGHVKEDDPCIPAEALVQCHLKGWIFQERDLTSRGDLKTDLLPVRFGSLLHSTECGFRTGFFKSSSLAGGK